jgi:hypothetical protein
MDDPRAQRTLVKSPPELWAEVSDTGALAGHLGAFGEIRITRLEPETTVAWEGDRARGTVELEPSGWGTKVTLTARIEGEREEEPGPAAAPEPVAPVVPETAPEPERAPEPARRRGLLARLFARRREPEAAPAPEARPQPAPAPEARKASDAVPPAALECNRAEAVLVGVLDDLGAARHRPFSRG